MITTDPTLCDAQFLPGVHVPTCSSPSSGCRDKGEQTEQLKQQKSILLQFWRPGVRDEGEGRAGVSGGLSPWLADAAFSLCLMVPLRMNAPCLCVATSPLLLRTPVTWN